MPIYLSRPMDYKITEAELDEIIRYFGEFEVVNPLPRETQPRPDQVLEATLTKEVIAKVLGCLPMSYRELLKLKFFEGFTLEEIGIRFWTQLGLDKPASPGMISEMEAMARDIARKKLISMGITSSKDLLPSG